MKKIFLLMLIMGSFSHLINAYEIEFYNNPSIIDTSSVIKLRYYLTYDSGLHIKLVRGNGNEGYLSRERDFFDTLSPISNGSRYYLNHSQFLDVLRSNQIYINDFYNGNNTIMPFLNFLYNSDIFGHENYINYENYELLYNSDGLAVESIVNGVWAGLYDDSEKSSSGKLYSSDGMLLYNNGEQVDYLQIFLDKLLSKFDTTLTGVFWILGTACAVGIIAYYVLDTLFFVVQMGVNVYTGLKYGKISW